MLMHHSGKTKESVLEEFERSISEMERVHYALVYGGQGTDLPPETNATTKNLYFGGEEPLDFQVKRYLTLARAWLEAHQRKGVGNRWVLSQIQKSARGGLIDRLEEMTVHSQELAEARSNFAQVGQILLGLVMMIFLWLGMGTVYKVKEGERLDEIARDNEERLRKILDFAPVGIFLTDAEGRCRFVNRHWLSLTGFSLEQAKDFGWAEALHPEDRDLVFKEWKLATETGRLFSMKYRFLRSDSTCVWVQGQAAEWKTGDWNGYVGSVQDITAMQKSEQTLANQRDELVRNQNLMNSILDHLPAALFCKDYSNRESMEKRGRFMLWNRRAKELWGLEPEEIIGQTDYELFEKEKAEEFRQADFLTMNSNKRIYIPEESIPKKGGGESIVRTWKVPVPDAEGTSRYLLGISLDITEQKELEAQLDSERLRSVNQEKMASLGEMAGGVAHEINNPLAIIDGVARNLEVLIRRGSPDVEKVNAMCERLRKTVKRIAKIVSSLRAFSRDASADPFEPAAVKEIVEETLDFCRERFKHHEVELRIGEIFPATIECRQIEISQVLINLLNNAFDAIAELPEKWVEVGVEDSGEYVEIHVTDSGSGLPEEIAEKIMQPFFTTKDLGKGTGLGLSISRGIVEHHNGVLRVDTSHKNTRFVLSLPKEQVVLEVAAAA